jgi:hypothetical protein
MPAAPDWPAGLWPQVGRCPTASVYFLHTANVVKFSNMNVVWAILHTNLDEINMAGQFQRHLIGLPK